MSYGKDDWSGEIRDVERKVDDERYERERAVDGVKSDVTHVERSVDGLQARISDLESTVEELRGELREMAKLLPQMDAD